MLFSCGVNLLILIIFDVSIIYNLFAHESGTPSQQQQHDRIKCLKTMPDPEQNLRGGAKFPGGCTFSTHKVVILQ